MAISINELEAIIKHSFPDAIIKLRDLADDEDHYALEIADKSFVGKSLINQHKLVKQALYEVMESRLHAITIKTIAENDNVN